MDLAALGFWIATAAGGLYMAGMLLRRGRGGAPLASRLPSAAVFGHGSLALAGLVVWGLFMYASEEWIGWLAVGILALVIPGGTYMFLLWQKDRKGSPEEVAAKKQRLAEQQIPSGIVHLHGALALGTVVLVVLATLGVNDNVG